MEGVTQRATARSVGFWRGHRQSRVLPLQRTFYSDLVGGLLGSVGRRAYRVVQKISPDSNSTLTT